MPQRVAVFGVQCFWGGDSLFAKLDGVLKTRVGYAGGTTPDPNYKSIGDHTEVVEAVYDDAVVSYEALLDYFWNHHNPALHRKKQYQSAILYVDDEQKALAEKSVAEVKDTTPSIETYVQPLGTFYQAEDYHQKYWLRCQPSILRSLRLSDAEVVSSPLAAKVNAFLAGYQNFDLLKRLQTEYNLSPEVTAAIEKIARGGGDPRACH